MNTSVNLCRTAYILYYKLCKLAIKLLVELQDCTKLLKGRKMGPLLVLVYPCFRKNVIATCKIVSFLCSWDNFLVKNVIVFLLRNQISKWRSFETKGLFLTYFSHFLVTKKFFQKNCSFWNKLGKRNLVSLNKDTHQRETIP